MPKWTNDPELDRITAGFTGRALPAEPNEGRPIDTTKDKGDELQPSPDMRQAMSWRPGKDGDK